MLRMRFAPQTVPAAGVVISTISLRRLVHDAGYLIPISCLR